ncbi:MAG: hemerythrin domain-containing protein [Candidatus Polarisedimenticolia bacterium]
MPARNRTKKNDAITLLKEDHKNVKSMLEDLCSGEQADAGSLMELCSQIEQALKLHTEVEEKLFYPAYRDAAESEDDKVLFFEAVEEHHAVDLILEDLKKADPASPSFLARAKVLDELVRHHIKEEEREMFPRAVKFLGEERLAEIGRRVAEMKAQAELATAGRRS